MNYRIRVKSRHPSHKPLRKLLEKLPFRSIVRLGSTTKSLIKTQCNTIDAVKCSANKLWMKGAFSEEGVKTAKCFHPAHPIKKDMVQFDFPWVIKHIYGSRGTGNYLIKNTEQLNSWMANHEDHSKYIIEQFHDYGREYRIHCSPITNTVYYTCRKMLKNGTPKADRWHRHNDNCVWIVRENPKFDEPINWGEITAQAIKAVAAVGLDIGAVDVKVQSAVDKKGNKRPDPEFIILETNSAPSFGKITLERYLEAIPEILKIKKQKI